MSHLLHLTGIASAALQRQDVAPLGIAFPVAPECAPFLVSSSASLMWIPQAFKTGEGSGATYYVNAAVRTKVTNLGLFYREVAEAAKKMAADSEWGSTNPGTADGIKAAIEYVKSFGLDKLEILAPLKTGFTAKSFDVELRAAPWLPSNSFVVVPADRRDLGFISPVAPGSLVAVIHNASRGMAFAWGEE